MDVIVTHSNADFDALASLVAAKKLYPKARLVLPSLQERSVRDFVNIVKDAVMLEDEERVDFKKMRRLIIVDTVFKSRIGKIAQYLTNPNLKVYCYDHHPADKGDIRSDENHFGRCGATVTLLLEIIKKRKIPITALEATIFALGIYEDTGSLTLNRQLSEVEIRLLSVMIAATKSYRFGGVEIALVCVSYEKDGADLAWVTHKLLEIENFSVIFAVIKIKNRIQIIARSRIEAVNVNKILRAFGGGGHASAASATLKDHDLEEVNRELLERVRKNIKSQLFARDLMSTPVKTLTSMVKVSKAKKTLDSLKIKVMPVVEQRKLAGIVSSKDLFQAIKQGYGHAPIKGYMRRKVITVTPKTSIYELQQILKTNNVGRIPVVSRGNLLGIISRTDILKSAHKDIFKATGRLKEKDKAVLSPRVSDLTVRMKTFLPQDMLKLLKELGKIADKSRCNVYLVGGFVRDLVMGRKNFDMDIVVEGDAIKYARLAAGRLKCEIKIHNRFKTAKLRLSSDLHIDIAAARTEFYEFPAALPVVASSSLRNDLFRRDFTVNTLAIGLNKNNFSRLIDFFNAEKDLREKRIRVLHDLSFVEDPTRILRAVRFEQRLDFTIDKHTENLIKAAVDLEMFGRLQKFRIADELMLLLNEPHPLKVIMRMAQLHELKFIHPGIKLNKRMIKLLEAVDDILGWYELSFIKRPLQRWLVYMLAVLEVLSEEQAIEIFSVFGFKKSVVECVIFEKQHSNKILKILKRSKKIKPSRVYEILEDLPLELVLFLMAKSKDLEVKEKCVQFLTSYATIKLIISGHDLKKLNLKPGPHFKQVLRKALFAKIDGLIKNKREELGFVKKNI
ncbi:MAG: CBS domain-containing protein [Candidatus Omnitrophica bacterium]|nr:CBS domain-containing protein [Candidatus Omnitrophota bacterium]